MRYSAIALARMAPRALVVAPGRVEDATLALGADPCPRLMVIALNPLLKHCPAAVVVLRVHVGLVPAFEARKALHDRVVGGESHRAKFARAVLLKLGAHEVTPGRRVAKTTARAVQRHETLTATDKVEDRRLAGRRKVVDVGEDGEGVVGPEHVGREVRHPVGVDKFDATRREHGLELREPLGGPVMAIVTEEKNLDRGFGGGEAAGHDAHETQQPANARTHHETPWEISTARHDEKLHSGSCLTAPPCMADSWAKRPVQVQLALWRALGYGSRPSTSAVTNSCTRCG